MHTSRERCRVSVLLTEIGCPFRKAPPPFVAEYVRVTHEPIPPANSTTTAATGTDLCKTPIEIAKLGYPLAQQQHRVLSSVRACKQPGKLAY